MLLEAAMLVLVLYFVIFKKKGSDDLPGPFRVPYLGAIQHIPKVMKGLMHHVHDHTTAIYGHHPMMKGGQPGTFYAPVSVLDADMAHQVLSTTKYVKSNTLSQKSAGLLDYALFVMPTGPDHKRHRKLAQASFGMDTTRSTSVASADACSIFDKEHSKTEGNMEISSLMTKITLEILGKVAFGQSLSSSAAEIFVNLEHDVSIPVIQRFCIPPLLWTWFGLGLGSPKIASTRNKLTNYVKNMVFERRKTGNHLAYGHQSTCLLDGLIKGEEGDILSDEELYGEIIGFFLAGHETTSSTLTFALLELAQSKEIQDDLYAAIKHLNFEDSDSIFLEVSKIDFLDYVFKETQRRHSIVGALQRNSTQVIQMMGYTFPKGSLFNVSIRGIHLNAKYYKDPRVFNPYRWSEPMVNAHAFLPFGDGNHQCIGKRMATAEFKVVLARLLKSYEFSVDPSRPDYILTTGITHRATNVFLHVKPRGE